VSGFPLLYIIHKERWKITIYGGILSYDLSAKIMFFFSHLLLVSYLSLLSFI
jgi:hypothetical protein